MDLQQNVYHPFIQPVLELWCRYTVLVVVEIDLAGPIRSLSIRYSSVTEPHGTVCRFSAAGQPQSEVRPALVILPGFLR
jgi:hypothetical protein